MVVALLSILSTCSLLSLLFPAASNHICPAPALVRRCLMTTALSRSPVPTANGVPCPSPSLSPPLTGKAARGGEERQQQPNCSPGPLPHCCSCSSIPQLTSQTSLCQEWNLLLAATFLIAGKKSGH
ncbi:hypothetical protein MHYP_G00286540 [Metynnis hypsauchen]